MLARIMAKREEEGVNNLKTFAMLFVTLALPFVLTAKQPDMGTAMVLAVGLWA